MLFGSGPMDGVIVGSGALGYAPNPPFVVAEQRFVHWAGR
jgi:hypothetical protein